MKTILVGLGNPILGDDGVGWRIVEAVEHQLARRPNGAADSPLFDVDRLSVGGLGLMEHLVDYDRAVLVDSISTGRAPQGTIATLPLQELPDGTAGHTSSAHDTSLPKALEVGRAMGAHLPTDIMVVAVEAGPTFDFSEQLSPRVAAAVPIAAKIVLDLLSQPEEKQ